jgi:hypothetical protein
MTITHLPKPANGRWIDAPISEQKPVIACINKIVADARKRYPKNFRTD